MTDEPRAATTMADVAREAGVSVMTVSNVVNERQARVSDATRARVREAIEATGYRLNVQARGLRRGRTGTVALAVPDFSSAYFGELGSRLERRLRRHGIRLVLESTGGVLAEELAALGASHLDAYDGLVLSLAADSTGEVARLSPAKPVVLVGERAAPPQLDHVGMDNVAGARRATDLLLDSGATRIAVVGAAASGPESMAVLRTRGHLESLAAHGLATRPELLIDCGVAEADGYRAVGALLASSVRFDAVLAMTDAAAIGVLAGLAEQGVAVPGQVQVVGWDNTVGGRYAVPALTSVDPDNEALADAVVELLVARLADPARPAEHRVVPHAGVVARGTTSAA